MTEQTNVLNNGVKMVSEVLVSPGTSLLLDGKIASGVTHMAGGVLSRALLGPVWGPVAIAGLILNSYSKSTTGTGLFGQYKRAPVLQAPQEQAQEPAKEA